MKNTAIAVSIFVVATGMAIAPRLGADQANQSITFTFSGPVEIPGQVLPAGAYVFKQLDFNDPNVVQVLNKDQTKIYATILAIPDYRLRPTGKAVITFEERAANTPEAVKAWFYPGDNSGHEFVYPKPRAVQLAKITNQPVPSMPANLEANTKVPAKSINEPQVKALRSAPLKAEQPSGQEVEAAQVFTPPPAQPTQLAQNRPPASLPKTASDLPLAGLMGLICASGGLLLLFRAKRLN